MVMTWWRGGVMVARSEWATQQHNWVRLLGFFPFLRLIDDRAVAVLVVPGCFSLLALLAAGLVLAACLLCRRRCVVRGRGRWPYCIIYVY
jgi:hypothetical protein